MKRKTFERYMGIIFVSLSIMTFTAVCTLIEYFLLPHHQTIKTLSQKEPETFTLIIDPGHGGMDSGAVGNILGLLEKDVNLEISKILYDLFKLTDIPVIMTRTEDVLLSTEGESVSKKTADLKGRVDIAQKAENPVFVSIHQNKFSLEKYKGLQVYYSKNNPDSQALAEIIQNKTAQFLQKDNKRQTKPAGRNIYVMHKLDCPAVLVECGFLSNYEEEKLLNTGEYRKKLAFVIFSCIMDYYNEVQKSNTL